VLNNSKQKMILYIDLISMLKILTTIHLFCLDTYKFLAITKFSQLGRDCYLKSIKI